MPKTETAHINPNGFREYDARWLYPKDINQEGIKNIGRGLGSQIVSKTNQSPRVIVGHDYRSYSEEVKKKLIEGLIDTGCNIEDIGLALSPTAYFAQFHLNADAVAMVTASHNENGWTGIKMGIEKGLTHSDTEMKELKNIVFKKKFVNGKGSYKEIKEFKDIYIGNLVKNKIKNKIKAVVACGNGTAGIFAPKVLKGIGCEVIELDCNLDYNFPKYNPNPEDLKMLRALSNSVKKNKANIGFAFDGDGDRLGLIDNKGNVIWADRQMILYSRDILSRNPGAKIVFDVKCSSLLPKDISEHGGEPIMSRTGHSFIKAKLKETNAALGGEMSGHIFFKERWYGFDDALYTGARLLEIMSKTDQTCEQVFANLPDSINTPEINIHFDQQGDQFKAMDRLAENVDFEGANIITIDGVRVDYPNGWGLVRPSNTTPCLVLRFEADNQQTLEEIQEKFRIWLRANNISTEDF